MLIGALAGCGIIGARRTSCALFIDHGAPFLSGAIAQRIAPVHPRGCPRRNALRYPRYVLGSTLAPSPVQRKLAGRKKASSSTSTSERDIAGIGFHLLRETSATRFANWRFCSVERAAWLTPLRAARRLSGGCIRLAKKQGFKSTRVWYFVRTNIFTEP